MPKLNKKNSVPSLKLKQNPEQKVLGNHKKTRSFKTNAILFFHEKDFHSNYLRVYCA